MCIWRGKKCYFPNKPRYYSNTYPQQNGEAIDYLKYMVECVQRKHFIYH